jgi:glycosyltransferase involved in cell wall biosynthesis
VEWIVVNDAPDDPPQPEVAAMLCDLAARLVTPEFNRGRSGARNLGASEAAGRFCEHVDGDDMPLPLAPEVFQRLDPRADLVLFPVLEWDGTGDVPLDGAAEPRTIKPAWSTFLPNLSPVDVRPAGTIWQREFFLRLGGYDARFEGAEDLQLAWRADRSEVQIARCDIPKQIYVQHPGGSQRERIFTEGHRRLWEWLEGRVNREAVEQRRLWLGKDVLQGAGWACRDLYKHHRAVTLFAGSMLRKLFKLAAPF